MKNNNVMKSSADILARIRNNSKANNDEVFTRLFRYLLRKDIYIAAFQKLYANDGALTSGIDDDTANGFSYDYIEEIISQLKTGTYSPNPVRRKYIPKRNGKLRPLGIPSFRDKLLQEVLRMYLEAIYEPLFVEQSHGFRPNRSCHTALITITKHFHDVPWIIEGDIAHCFDDINHETLISILSMKIKDARFLNLIRKLLKAGYMEDWTYHSTYSGCPQGGCLSPILMNIYMHQFDLYILKLADKFNTSKTDRNPRTKEYSHYTYIIQRLTKEIDNSLPGDDRKRLIAEKKSIMHKRLRIPSCDHIQRKLTYVRYADDWLIGVYGNKKDCEAIRTELTVFLKNHLQLTLSEEKTLITHSSKRIRFLGYDFYIRRNLQFKRHKMHNRYTLKRVWNGTVSLQAPLEDKINEFMFSKGAVQQTKDGRLRAIHRSSLMRLTDREIVYTYNAEVRGILNYYAIADNYRKLNYFRYLMELSCLKTLAFKHKTTVTKIRNKYRDGQCSWSIPYNTKEGLKRAKIATLAECRTYKPQDVDSVKTYQPFQQRQIWHRFSSGLCELCGDTTHGKQKILVVKRLKDLGFEPWECLMKRMRRKTLVLCPACFMSIHSSCGQMT